MRIRSIARLCGSVLVGGVGFSQRSGLRTVGAVLVDARLVPLALALILCLVSIANRGAVYRSTHRAVGLDARLAPMMRVSAAAYGLNKMVKTGGAGGIALFVRYGTRREHAPGAVTAAYLLGGLAAQVGLAVVFVAALTNAAWTGSMNTIWMGAAVGFGCYAAIAAMITAAAVRRRESLHRIQRFGARLGRRIPRRFTRRRARSCSGGSWAGGVDDFFDSVQLAKHHPRMLMPAVTHAIADKLLGALVLACSLLAAGGTVDVGNILTVYVIALVASMVGFLPGGIGAVEASIATLLIAQGVPAPTAAGAIVIFRLIDMWLPLAVGSLAARSLLVRPPVVAPELATMTVNVATEPDPIKARDHGRRVEAGHLRDLAPVV